MEKALLLVLLTLSYRITSGQFCTQLPQPSEIFTDFSSQLNRADESATTRQYNYNCVAYDGTTRNYRETTVTVRYITGSSTFSAQATYVCGDTGNGGYVWAIGTVMADGGTVSTETRCRDCRNMTPTTCTPCDTSACSGNGLLDIYCASCECNEGYTGANCSADIDECALAQPVCEGGANCTNNIGSFTCTCPDPCTGDCNACCSSPCQKGGTCTSNNTDSFFCTCPPGFIGTTCTEFEGGCYSSPCMNDGECVDTSDADNPVAYRCSCPVGFTGVDCETAIDYCAPKPCKNSGWCTSMTTGFTCTCIQGFTGVDCSQPLQTCQSNPSVCGTNGVCSSRTIESTAFYCSCSAGYTGESCEQNVTTCIDNRAPCLNQGTCNSSADGNGFNCSCSVGYWEGFYCADCGLPCVNGYRNGDCTACICDDPWVGDACENITGCTSYDEDGNCDGCEGNLVPRNNSCITQTTSGSSDDNTAETIGIILGCVVGAIIILIVVFVFLFIALRYVQLSGIANMRRDDPTLLEKQQARLSGFFAPKSTLFSSGGHTGGIKTGVKSSFPSYKEMTNRASPPTEDAYENSPAATSSPEYEDVNVNPDDEWLPPPDD